MPEQPDTASPTRRLVVVALTVAAVVLAVTIGGVALLRARSSPTRFCTLELVISEDGTEQYHRDPKRDCQYVDQHGDLPPAR